MTRLKAAVDFKQGVGYLYDPETGKRYEQWLIDWKWFGDNAPMHLTFHFEQDDLTTIEGHYHETT